MILIDAGRFLADVIVMTVPEVAAGWGNVLFNGFDTDIDKDVRKDKIPVTFAHFQPLNQWKEGQYGRFVDLTTGESYCNDDVGLIRLKCALVFAATVLVQSVGLLLNLVNRIVKVVSFMHLWHPSPNDYQFKARLAEMGEDLLRIVTTPLIFVGFFFASLYGATIRPYDGRKLYATLERAAYAGGQQRFPGRQGSFYGSPPPPISYLISPCFQPEPKTHLLGGDINLPNQW